VLINYGGMDGLLRFCEKFNSDGKSEETLKSKEFAEYLDANDELSHFRTKFNFPKVNPDDPDSKEYFYFCGNSLGLQPKTTSDEVNREISKWARYGVEGHWKGELPWVTIDDDVNELVSSN
jgi:kynureninase